MQLSDGRILVFVHIPKTGGTTLESILNRQYGRKNGYRVNLSYLYEEEEVNQTRETLKKIRGYKFIKGHFTMGLEAHRFLESPCRYITMLREPMERIISDYHFILRTPQHHHYEPIQTYKMTVGDYVSSPWFFGLDNYQTRALCDRDLLNADGSCSTSALESAKKNLRRFFPGIGLMEKFDESLLLFQKALQWQQPFYGKENVTANRPPIQAHTQETVALLQEINRYDLDLYAYVRSLFEQQVEALYPLGFERTLCEFQLLNRYFSKVYKYYQKGRDLKYWAVDTLSQSLPALNFG